MEEADSLCNRIGIIDKGKILVIDNSQNLKKSVGDDVITIGTEETKKFSKLIETNKISQKTTIHDSTIEISVKSGEEKIPVVMKLADKNKIQINSISLRKPTLEDVFLHFTGKTIREEEVSSKDSMRLHARMWGGGR